MKRKENKWNKKKSAAAALAICTLTIGTAFCSFAAPCMDNGQEERVMEEERPGEELQEKRIKREENKMEKVAEEKIVREKENFQPDFIQPDKNQENNIRKESECARPQAQGKKEEKANENIKNGWTSPGQNDHGFYS